MKQFDVNKRGFASTKDYGELGGHYVGMATTDDSIITCLSNGHLTVWQNDEAKVCSATISWSSFFLCFFTTCKFYVGPFMPVRGVFGRRGGVGLEWHLKSVLMF